MLAIAAAVLFGLALLFKLIGSTILIFNPEVLLLAGLLCAALHFAGVGNTTRVRSHTVRSHTRRSGWRRSRD